ncbi:MAG: biopolymer transporter ExbD, partial [Verrucomicrobiota bacterium]|nr:biopolymer transporter ExbD [Verrucomicrobiota bacterium]
RAGAGRGAAGGNDMNFRVKRRRKPEVIIVSLIDIFAILLIFMVMTTQFVQEQPEVTIKLPESKTAVASERNQPSLVLSISEAEEIFVGPKKVSVGELKGVIEELLKQTPPPLLALNADRKAPFGTVIKVLDVLKEAGVKGNLAAFTEMAK